MNEKCFEGIQEEHDDFLKDIEKFAVSFRSIEITESFKPELDFVTYCPEKQFRLVFPVVFRKYVQRERER